MHVCVDDATRLAYVEVLDDEKATTAIGFLKRAIAFYGSHGITVQELLTDNGGAYRSTVHAIACRALGIRHLRTRPYRPQTNGKAERFIRTMLGGWAYGAIYRNSAERTAALSGWLERYNWRRPHGALNHKPPGTPPSGGPRPRSARLPAGAREPARYRVLAETPLPPDRLQESMPAHDVLIIGAGLAGQRAALAAAQQGASVAIMSKVHPVRSHSVAAAGGINAAISVDDDWRSHAYDTVKGSDFLGDQDAIEVMCSEAPQEVMDLEHMGVTFHRNDRGEMDLRAFGGASMKRTAYVADITGQALLHVLYEQLMKHHETVERYEEWFTTSLLTDDAGNCCGVIARDIRTGSLEIFKAKNVILACGGAGQAYRPDDQRPDRDRRRDLDGLPDRRSADGHGDGPVPPDLPGRDGHADHRGRQG